MIATTIINSIKVKPVILLLATSAPPVSLYR
jgi:hypothetical protein